ncbi:MAG: redoxin domain-containing protein [Pseudomonadota bacterium]
MAFQFLNQKSADEKVVNIPAACQRTVKWLPQIGDIFPDFTVNSTHGEIRFWDWAPGNWVHLFSHPAAFTPVCTTELASIAAYQQAWDDNGIKHLALTGSTLEEQEKWHKEIEEFFDVSLEYPGAYDPDLTLSRNFGMLHHKESQDWPIRKSFILDPAMRVQMISEYPLFVGRNIDELLRVTRALQLRAQTGAATPADWYWGDVAIISDNRTEADVIRQFKARSSQLMPYLRVVDPTAT